jgi:hypothetical protein
MLTTLWILAAANLTFVLYHIISKKAKPAKPQALADQVSFLDVPDEVLEATPVMPKNVSFSESSTSQNWWDQKINLPRSGQAGSRRGRKIEHDQLLLSDLDNNL